MNGGVNMLRVMITELRGGLDNYYKIEIDKNDIYDYIEKLAKEDGCYSVIFHWYPDNAMGRFGHDHNIDCKVTIFNDYL